MLLARSLTLISTSPLQLNRGIRVSSKINAGTVWINCVNQLNSQVPFGGVGQSFVHLLTSSSPSFDRVLTQRFLPLLLTVVSVESLESTLSTTTPRSRLSTSTSCPEAPSKGTSVPSRPFSSLLPVLPSVTTVSESALECPRVYYRYSSNECWSPMRAAACKPLKRSGSQPVALRPTQLPCAPASALLLLETAGRESGLDGSLKTACAVCIPRRPLAAHLAFCLALEPAATSLQPLSFIPPSFVTSQNTMGLSISKLLSGLFGKKEMRTYPSLFLLSSPALLARDRAPPPFLARLPSGKTRRLPFLRPLSHPRRLLTRPREVLVDIRCGVRR